MNSPEEDRIRKSSSPLKRQDRGRGERPEQGWLEVLETMKPATPSESFERRMAALFENTQPHPALWRRNIAAWQAVAACLCCAALGFGANQFLQPPTPVTEPPIQTHQEQAPSPEPRVRSAFDLTDPTPFKAVAASPAIQVIIETADWDDHS